MQRYLKCPATPPASTRMARSPSSGWRWRAGKWPLCSVATPRNWCLPAAGPRPTTSPSWAPSWPIARPKSTSSPPPSSTPRSSIPAANWSAQASPVTYVRPGPDGVVDPDDIRRALRPETVLVSVMHANNETGALQPIAEIAAIAHQAGALMHSDGVQAAGKIPVDVARARRRSLLHQRPQVLCPQGHRRPVRENRTPSCARSSSAASTSANAAPAPKMSRAPSPWRKPRLSLASTCPSSPRAWKPSAIAWKHGILARVPDTGVNAGTARPHSQHHQYLFRRPGRRSSGHLARPQRFRGLQRIGLLQRRRRTVARAARHGPPARTRPRQLAIFPRPFEQ